MKTNSLKNKIFASALSVALCVGSLATSVYAVPVGTADAPKLVIKKVLNLPAEGVNTPAETFTFAFEKHSKNGKEADKAQLPEIANKTVTYADTDKTDGDSATEGKQVVKLTGDVLAGINFASAGQYTYRVTETAGSTADMTYSKAAYLVSIFTKTVGDSVVVDSIQIKKEKNDSGAAETTTGKTPYVPGTEANGEGNNFVFNNNYDKKGGNDNPGGNEIQDADKKGFVLKKVITGDNQNVDEKFTFNIKAVKPVGSNSTDTTFDYYIINNEGNKSEKKTATYGTAFDVTLKHTERVVFANVLLGTKVSATETVDGGYTKSINAASKLNGQAVSLDNLGTGMVIGNVGDNSVIFENTQQTATGILINNLPFIALALMAGLGIFFFIKNRREEEEV